MRAFSAILPGLSEIYFVVFPAIIHVVNQAKTGCGIGNYVSV